MNPNFHPLQDRIEIAWGFIYFFLALNGRVWEDVSDEDRYEIWSFVGGLN